MSVRWKALRNATYLAMLVASGASVVYWWPLLLRIWSEQALTFVGAAVLMVLGTAIQVRSFIAFIDGPSSSVRALGLTDVWALAALVNYAGPFQPGVAVRVAYLAQRGVDVTEGLLATSRQICASLWIAFAGLSLGLLLTLDPRGYWPAALAAAVFLVSAALRRAMLSWLDQDRWPIWLARRKQLLRRAITGIARRGIAGVVLQYLLGTALLMWTYRRFGADIGTGQALIMACMVFASSLVALLPSNLGVAEGLYILGGRGLGLPLTDATALAVLLRAAHISANLSIVLAGTLVRGLSVRFRPVE